MTPQFWNACDAIADARSWNAGARRTAARVSRCKPVAPPRPRRPRASAASTWESATSDQKRENAKPSRDAQSNARVQIKRKCASASGDDALTRFTHGISNQNLAASNVSVAVRAIVDGRTGVAAANDLSDASIDALLARAREMASFAPRDEASPRSRRAAGASTARRVMSRPPHLPIRRRAHGLRRDHHARGARGYWCAGYVSSSSDGMTIANSSGALASFDGTVAGVNVKATAPDSTGFAEHYTATFERSMARTRGPCGRARALERAAARGRARPMDGDFGAAGVRRALDLSRLALLGAEASATVVILLRWTRSHLF